MRAYEDAPGCGPSWACEIALVRAPAGMGDPVVRQILNLTKCDAAVNLTSETRLYRQPTESPRVLPDVSGLAETPLLEKLEGRPVFLYGSIGTPK
jgi:hypothetical protein